MRFPEYEAYDAVGLAALINKGEISSEEVLEAAIERIELLNPVVNAIAYKIYKAVMRRNAKVFALMSYTTIFNITGQPAMSVPLYWNRQNLPIGSQFVARFAADATLFQLAYQLEKAQPWAHQLPPILQQIETASNHVISAGT